MVKDKDIKLIRLITGEVLVAEYLRENSSHVKFKNPLVITARQQAGSVEPVIGFVTWMPYTDDEEIPINHSAIVVIVTPLPEFVAKYKEAFSKIWTPPTSGSKLIIP